MNNTFTYVYKLSIITYYDRKPNRVTLKIKIDENKSECIFYLLLCLLKIVDLVTQTKTLHTKQSK